MKDCDILILIPLIIILLHFESRLINTDNKINELQKDINFIKTSTIIEKEKQ